MEILLYVVYRLHYRSDEEKCNETNGLEILDQEATDRLKQMKQEVTLGKEKLRKIACV